MDEEELIDDDDKLVELDKLELDRLELDPDKLDKDETRLDKLDDVIELLDGTD